jgi:hypothetical protein
MKMNIWRILHTWRWPCRPKHVVRQWKPTQWSLHADGNITCNAHWTRTFVQNLADSSAAIYIRVHGLSSSGNWSRELLRGTKRSGKSSNFFSLIQSKLPLSSLRFLSKHLVVFYLFLLTPYFRILCARGFNFLCNKKACSKETVESLKQR